MINEELKRYLDRVNREIDADKYECREAGCDERTIETESLRFKKKTGLNLSNEYLDLMAETNGVLFNDMVIHPLRKHNNHDETILQFNEDMREQFSDEFIYYGKFDEELYCFHIPSGQYQAIEYVGSQPWKVFDSADSMFIFMMKRRLFL